MVIKYGKKLLGTGAKEHDYALAAMEPAARLAHLKKTLRSRLGMNGAYTDEDLLPENDTISQSASNGSANLPSLPRLNTAVSSLSRQNSLQSPVPAESPRGSISGADSQGLTARQLNQLKRKNKANAKDQARKVRILDLGGSRRDSDVPTPISDTPAIKTEDSSESKDELFSLERNGADDDSKIVADFKGAIVPAKPAIQTDAEVEGLEWPFEKLCDILSIDVFDQNWEIRHGAAMALREIVRSHGAGAGRSRGKSRSENDALNAAWLDNLASRYCCVLMLDHFGDYISDNVVAPIRETTGQALATLLLHLPEDRLASLYQVLRKMVLQDTIGLSQRIWQVCHGGMLGFKYLGAVRKDFLMTHLDGIVEAAIRGLTDFDDDVRAVSAATLTPIAEDLVRLRPNLLQSLMNIVWDCLSESRDDLSASTGNVMDLLAKLCNHEAVIEAMKQNALIEGDEVSESEYSFQKLVPRLYPFLRHTIASVRSAVLRALQTFLQLADPNTKTWVDSKILRLIFQNIIVERYDDVLNLSAQVWDSMGELLKSENHFLREFEAYPLQLLWMALHPIGVPRHPIPMDYSLIMKPSGQLLAEPASLQRKQSSHSPISNEPPTKRRRKTDKKEKEEPIVKSHNIDGHMLQGDIDLVDLDILIRSRIYGARAYGKALALAASEGQLPAVYEQLAEGLVSPYATTQMNASMIIEEGVKAAKGSLALPDEVYQRIKFIIEDERPEAYAELVGYLQIARAQCQSLVNVFRDQGKVPPSKLPHVAVVVQGDPGAGPQAFSIANAESIITNDFERLKKSMSSAQRLTSTQALTEARSNVTTAIEEAQKAKVERDIRVRAAAAGALVALQDIPKKPTKLIKGLMDSVKSEEISDLQKRSAFSVASLISFYASGQAASRGPADKVIGNLLKFYCVDTSDTPEYIPNAELQDAILSLRKEEDRKDHADTAKYEAEAKAARITRRGAKEAIDQLSRGFGSSLFINAPTLEAKIREPLQTVLGGDSEVVTIDSPELGQDAVDSLSILRLLVPTLHSELHSFVDEMIPYILKALKCQFSVLRYAAAKCFATICSVWTVKGMTILVEKVLPAIANPLYLQYRQGAIETVYHLIHIMEDNILPYVVFLIVPILGRMSDSNSEVRLIATTTFATLVKLVPLEAGIPDPPGFSEELLKGRDKERKFVAQMLDPKKTEPFEIPVAIKATLRSYQQDGVNWLYFLNRFNLHGVLCDDMGLGKTLQTICIVASDHHLRAQEFAKTQAPEVRRLPSLIVCPPTLSGHWQQEIKAYAPFLSSVAYVGPPNDRARLKSQLTECDIIITSYDVCRNDIDTLAPFNWNYCVLDEGHLIKNPRAKTTLAVKRLNSNHRLILSGTPIQNNVLELWSLFDFLMPGFLGTEKLFQERFAKPIAASRNAKSSSKEQERGALAIESLHKQVLPFLLRRLKEEVLEDLPPKIVQNYYCDLSELQKRLFDDFTRKEKKNLEAKAGSEDREAKQHIFQALQYMRKLCNSPSLVVREGFKQYEAVKTWLANKNTTIKDISHAPKLGALRDLLVDCGIGTPPPAEGELGTEANYVSPHRALIFCQMKEMLDIVQNDVLKKLLPSVQFLRLDGSVEASRRQNIVNQFNTDPSFDVLLLTTSVGGLGLNLTGADTVIFVEHDWNPQKDMQAMDRAHHSWNS
jgi:TATA-binding protein-associated factor